MKIRRKKREKEEQKEEKEMEEHEEDKEEEEREGGRGASASRRQNQLLRGLSERLETSTSEVFVLRCRPDVTVR